MRFERIISTIDAHAAGEPLRIITAGLPPLPGATVLERRRYMAEHYDDIRRTLLFEPRGHADMYGAVLTPPVTPGADFGVLFLTNEGYSTMCGHGVIALTTVLLETGMVPRREPRTEVVYDSPAGLIRAECGSRGRSRDLGGVSERSRLPLRAGSRSGDERRSGARGRRPTAAPSTRWSTPPTSDVEVLPENAATLTRLGMEIKRAVDREIEVVHPG